MADHSVVWVVSCGEYDDQRVVGVYSSLGLALASVPGAVWESAGGCGRWYDWGSDTRDTWPDEEHEYRECHDIEPFALDASPPAEAHNG